MRAGETIGALLLLLGALRVASAFIVAPPVDARVSASEKSVRIDARYAPLREELAARAGRSIDAGPRAWTLGYLSESGLATLEGQRRFGEASYALAPWILLPDDGVSALVLVDLDRPERVAEVARHEGLQLVRATPGGAALLSREGRDAK